MVGFRNKIWDGATTDSYQDSLKTECLNWREKLVVIKNTHGSNGIKYTVYGVADLRDEANSTHVLQAEATLAAGGTAIHAYDDPWDSIYVQVKNASAGNNASAKIWLNGYA